MMTALSTFLLSQSVLIPILIGLLRFRRMDKIYYPFFILLIIGFLAEVVSFILIRSFHVQNAPANNIYFLLECYLLLYQLYLWKNSKKGYSTFLFFAGISVVAWFIQNILFFKINTFDSPFFQIYYAFLLVLLSINHINIIMVRPKGALLQNPQMILCVGFIAFFIYQIIYYASRFISNEPIQIMITSRFAFINFAINVLYAFAVYLMTIKRKENYYGYFNDR